MTCDSVKTCFEEISESRRTNRSFWNSEVRFRIALIRAEQKAPTTQNHMGYLWHALGKCLQRRSEFMFLDKSQEKAV